MSDFSKQPKWVQEHIEHIEMLLREAKQAIAERDVPVSMESKLIIDPYRDFARTLPGDSILRFVTESRPSTKPGQTYTEGFDVSFRKRRDASGGLVVYLNSMSSGALHVIPSGTNSVYLVGGKY